MKQAFFGSILFFAFFFVAPFKMDAQIKQSTLKTAQINELTAKGDGVILNRYLTKEGFAKGKLLHAQRYELKEGANTVFITVVATEYTKTAANKKKVTAEYSHIEIVQGDKKEVLDIVEENGKVYNVSKGAVLARKASCDPVKIATNLISSASNCKNCLNQVKSCINSNKGKAWKMTICLIKNASSPCFGCVSGVAKLISSIIACI